MIVRINDSLNRYRNPFCFRNAGGSCQPAGSLERLEYHREHQCNRVMVYYAVAILQNLPPSFAVFFPLMEYRLSASAFSPPRGALWYNMRTISDFGTGVVGRTDEVGRTDTVLTQKENVVRHCQQSPICPLTSYANTADIWHCKWIPFVSLALFRNANGTIFSCSIVDM